MKRNERIAALRARRNAMKENDELIDDAVNAAPAPQQVPMPAPVDGQQPAAPAADPAMQQPGPMNPLVPPQPGMIPTGWMFPNQSAQAVAMDTGDVNLAGAAPGGGVVGGSPVTNEEAQMIEEYRKYKKQKRLEKLAKRLARKVKESSEEELEPEIPAEVNLDMPPEDMDDSADFEDEESDAVITADDLEDVVVDINKLFADAGGDLASVTSEDAFEDEEIAQEAEDAVKDELAKEDEEEDLEDLEESKKTARSNTLLEGDRNYKRTAYSVRKAFPGIDPKAADIITGWYCAEGAVEDFDTTDDFAEFIKDDVLDMLDAGTDSADVATVKASLASIGFGDFAEEDLDFDESRKPRRKENRLVDELSEEEMDLGPEGLDDLEWDPEEVEESVPTPAWVLESNPPDDEWDMDDVLDDMDPGNASQDYDYAFDAPPGVFAHPQRNSPTWRSGQNPEGMGLGETRKPGKRSWREAALTQNAVNIKFPAGTPAPNVSADAVDAAYKTFEPESSSIQAFEKKAAIRRAVLAELRKQRNARRKENLMDADLSDACITQEDVIDEVIPGSNKSAILESKSFRPSEKFLESYREKQKLDYKAMLKQGLLG